MKMKLPDVGSLRPDVGLQVYVYGFFNKRSFLSYVRAALLVQRLKCVLIR